MRHALAAAILTAIFAVACIVPPAAGETVLVPLGTVPPGARFTIRYRLTIGSAEQIGPTAVGATAVLSCTGCAPGAGIGAAVTVPDTFPPPAPAIDLPAEGQAVNTPDQVATIRPQDGDALIGYYEAVAARTASFLRSVTPEMLDRVVDERWDPPVTMGVRIISVADDDK